MFTSIDKFVAALIMPVITLLVMRGVLPESEAQYWEQIAMVLVTAGAVWLVPNKRKVPPVSSDKSGV